eukprot:jgi/Chrzof1/13058/Cz07g18100.t1
MSYIYHALAAYFDRDNVCLPGFAAFFKKASDEERDHANKLMVHQNSRGGRVKLQTISSPESEFNHSDKGDALFALELALSLEKLNMFKLRQLHGLAAAVNDSECCQFIDDELLRQSTKDVKATADLVSQLRRAGQGHGTFQMDLALQHKYGYGISGETGEALAA